MKWLRRLSHRFWLWVDKKIVIHRVEESIKKTKERLIKEADSLIDDTFLDRAELDGLEAIVDDSTDVAEYGGLEPAPKGTLDVLLNDTIIEHTENEPIDVRELGTIRKGYDKQ